MPAFAATPISFIYTRDRDKALAYYIDVIGLTLRSSDPFGDFLGGPHGLVRLTVLPDFRAGEHPVLGWEVADIETVAAKLRDRGVSFTIYEGMGQDADGIWTAPDGGAKVGWFKDPDGNVLSLTGR